MMMITIMEKWTSSLFSHWYECFSPYALTLPSILQQKQSLHIRLKSSIPLTWQLLWCWLYEQQQPHLIVQCNVTDGVASVVHQHKSLWAIKSCSFKSWILASITPEQESMRRIHCNSCWFFHVPSHNYITVGTIQPRHFYDIKLWVCPVDISSNPINSKTYQQCRI